jgi:hypothetical protein
MCSVKRLLSQPAGESSDPRRGRDVSHTALATLPLVQPTGHRQTEARNGGVTKVHRTGELGDPLRRMGRMNPVGRSSRGGEVR